MSQNTLGVECFWQSSLSKMRMRLWCEALFEAKMSKELDVRKIFGVAPLRKSTRLWRKAHVQFKLVKTHHVQCTFGSLAAQKTHAATC